MASMKGDIYVNTYKHMQVSIRFLLRLIKVMWHMTKYGDPYSEFVLCI